MEEFQLSKFTNEGAKLLREITAEFERLGLDTTKLPKVFPDDGGAIKLVFVGQYSAGKSSIIKMLTGAEVAIGAKITTQDSKPYPWNGLEIVDTPGIHTELRPDHDEITYDQINHAALLIFVITNEGFSQRMGEHFRQLAIEQKRAGNMVLVVNKMDRTALGNVPEQQEIIYEDLKKVTAPHDPKDMYLSFLDTSAFFDSLEEADADLKAELLETSRHDEFVENLNRFVTEKGLLQKINLPLNTLAAEIRLALGVANDEKNADIAQFVETIRKRRNIFLDCRRECLDDIRGIINQYKGDLSRYGREVADNVISQKSKEDAEEKLRDAQERTDVIAIEYANRITGSIKNFITKTEYSIKTYEDSAFVQQVNTNLIRHFNADDPAIAEGFGAAAGVGGMVAGAFILEHGARIAYQIATPAMSSFGNVVSGVVSTGVSTAIEGELGAVSLLFGEEIGMLSNELGNIFGGFFRQEATFSNRIASAFTGSGSKILGAGLAIGGAALSIVMLNRANRKAEEVERNRRNARENIMSEFRNIADNVAGKMNDGVNQWMTQNVEPIIIKFDEEINAIEDQLSISKAKSEKLTEMLNRTENLIGEIQASS